MLAPELTPEQRLHEQVAEGARATCPCCGYPVIRGRGDYDICPICAWEDDGQDDADRAPSGRSKDPDAVLGGPNSDYSLTEARENFVEYVTMYRPTDRDFERERARTDFRRRVMTAFDRAVDGEVTFAQADAEATAMLDELAP